jgi:hypothetical protein
MGRQQLPEGDDPADGDQKEYDRNNSIDRGGERYWRLGDPSPLKEIPAVRVAVAPVLFPFARHVPAPQESP